MKRILVVDNDPAVVKVLSQNLIDYGYEALQASSTAVALEIVTEASPDLVITGVFFQEGTMNGLALIEAIERISKTPKFLILTGQDCEGVSSTTRTSNNTVVDIFFKPPDFNALMKKVSQLLATPN